MSEKKFEDKVDEELVDVDPVKAGLAMAVMLRRLACNRNIKDADAILMASDLLFAALDPELEARRQTMHTALQHSRLRLTTTGSFSLN